MNSKDLMLVLGLGVVGFAVYEMMNGGFMSSFPSDWDTSATAQQYVPFINSVESQYGLPQNYLAAVAFQESSFNPSAVNPTSGATGMFQLMPCYYPGAGQSWQADAATAAAALKAYYNQFGDWQMALAAYNWGPGNLQGDSGGYACLPSETQNYVTAISNAVPVQGSLVTVAA